MKTNLHIATAILSVAVFLNAHAETSQIVYTDKTDYPPGSTAVITGSGFAASSTVTLQVTHVNNPNDTDADHFPWVVPTDSFGNISSSWYVNPVDAAGEAFRLTADGADGLHAEWDFTDSNPGQDFEYSPNKEFLTVAAGSTGSFPQNVTSKNITTTTLRVDGPPAYQSWISTDTTSLDFKSAPSTLTWNIIVSVPAGTAEGTYFLGRVKVTGDGGQGSGTGLWVTVTSATQVLTVAADDASRVYGAANPAFTYTVSGLLPGDSISVIIDCSVPVTAPVGPYQDAIVITSVTPAASNTHTYTIFTSPGTLTITPATLTIFVDNQEMTYGGPLPTLTGTLSGVLNNDGITISGYSTTATVESDVSPPLYPIIATLSDPFNKLGNYTKIGGSGCLEVLPAPLTVTPDSFEITFGDPLPTLTGTVIGIKNDDDIKGEVVVTYSTSATNFNPPPAGTYDITADVSGSEAFDYAITKNKGTLQINRVQTTSIVIATPPSQQYSDIVTFTATICHGVAGGQQAANQVTFSVGSQVLGTVPLVPNGSALIGTLTTALLEPVPFGTAPTGQMAPGIHTVTADFGTTNPNFIVNTPATTSLTITKEDARATYTGSTFVSTNSPTSSQATVTLSATIQDITACPTDSAYDSKPGDIRNATVTFINRDNNTVIKSGLAVGLVNASDTKTGTVTYNWSVDIGTANSQTYTIGIIVCNYYTRNSSADNTVITVSKGIGTGFITGGGYLVLSNSAGLCPGGVGTKNNFGFNVKYNKGWTNLQGSFNSIVRNNGRIYQIKSNSLTSLTVTTTSAGGSAIFDAKANIQDITDSANPISIDGNASLHVTMTDNGEPGTKDTIGITVFNKSGGLWYSSNWNGLKTSDQVISGGNLQVH